MPDQENQNFPNFRFFLRIFFLFHEVQKFLVKREFFDAKFDSKLAVGQTKEKKVRAKTPTFLNPFSVKNLYH